MACFSLLGMGCTSHPSLEELACILQKCRKEKDALRFHAYLRKCGLEAHLLLGNYLVSLLVEVGKISSAEQVFSKLVYRSNLSWNNLITGYVICKNPLRALTTYQNMQKDSSAQPNGYAYVALLTACTSLKDMENGLGIHAEVARKGLLEKDIFVGSVLVDMYAKCGSLGKARQVLDTLPVRNEVVWNAIMVAYAKQGHAEQVLECLQGMQLDGVALDAISFVCCLKACSSIRAADKGCEIHAEIERKGLFQGNLLVGSALVDMYAKCGLLLNAQEVFDRLPVCNVVVWTALISGYVEQGLGEEALKYFEQMQSEEISPNAVTFVCSLKACSNIGAADKGQEIHAEIERKSLLTRELVGNTVVDMYAKCGMLAKAQEVFDRLPVRNMVSWTALISGYTEHGQSEQALECFEQVQLEGFSPDAATFVCSLKACANKGALDKGEVIHAEVERNGLLEQNHLVGNALIEMYAKCGAMDKAQKVFNILSVRDKFSWNLLIAGYAEHGQSEEAIKCFKEMESKGMPADAFSLVCILKACGSVGAVEKGGEIHEVIEKQGLMKDLIVANSIIDMYTKCGLLHKAQQVFDKLPVRDLVSWTALMAGYIEHGHGEEALNCFEKMQIEGLYPDDFTFVCSLKACGSIKAIDKGQKIHAEIERTGLQEKDLVVHSTLIDMYTKCGSLDKAQQVFDKLTAHDLVSWNSLIAAYAEHGHGDKAFKCFKQMQLESVSADTVTFVFILKTCGSVGAIDIGQEIHAMIETTGILEEDLVVGNTLVDMYAKCGLLDKAQEVSDKLTPNNVSLTSLMAGYAKLGLGEKVFECFKQIQTNVVPLDVPVYVCSLKAFGSIGATCKGQEIHAEIVRKGFLETELAVNIALVDMYSKCGLLSEARHVFDKMSAQNVVSWTALIAGYIDHGQGDEALDLFEQMQFEGMSADALTFACSLNSCGSIGAIDKGREIHAEVARKGWLYGDPVVCNSLINMYAKCGLLAKAYRVFNELPFKDVSSWNALITGYAEQGNGQEAFRCFKQMQLEGLHPNSVTFVYSLRTCCSICSTNKGQDLLLKL